MAKKTKRDRLDYGKIADALGASKRVKINAQGLEVTLNIRLDKKPYRIGYFPSECLDGYDLNQNKVILSQDYGVWQKLGSGTFFFRSSAPDRPMIFIPESKIVSIKRLSDSKVLYHK